MAALDATPVESPLVQAVMQAHTRVSGKLPVIGAGHRMGATADTCHFKGVGIRGVEYGPGFIPIWPMIDECIELAQLEMATKVLALVAMEICTVTEDGEWATKDSSIVFHRPLSEKP